MNKEKDKEELTHTYTKLGKIGKKINRYTDR